MSFELVLLLAVFVLLPLIQLVMRAAPQGDRRVPDHSKDGPPSANRPVKREAAIAAPAVPSPPPAARHTVAHAMPSRPRTPRRDARGFTVPRPTARYVGRRPMESVADLDDRSGLRRAIVLTAILGPCRANDPHARSESGLP